MTIRLQIDRLDWDDWNREHIAKHGMVPEDVEISINNVLLIKPSYRNRSLVICAHPNGRILTVVIGEDPNRPGIFYVFSARLASRKERRDAFQEHEP